MAVALSACGGDSTATPPAATAASGASSGDAAGTAPTATTADASGGTTLGGSAQPVSATLKEWAVEVPSTDLTAGSYKFTVTNDGSFSHNMKILDASGNEVAGTPNFAKAESPKEFEANLPAGTYTFICTIPGHAGKGMKTEVTVK